jgi:DNA-directed RNA polymerase subunit beta'
MRTFHTGGVASAEDITQGLPRVEELFEGRKPKSLAIISEIDGVVRLGEEKKKRVVYVTSTDPENPDERSYPISFGGRIRVQDGDVVKKGDRLTEGSINPHDVLAVSGAEAVQNYLIQEVQRTYRMQGVDINDKHVEVIVRQMMRKVKVDDAGDTYLLGGAMIDRSQFDEENARVRARIDAGEVHLKEATCSPVLLGITKASLATDSFLSAASFQETTRVLTDAAIKGKVDPLLGLKENVIIGKLIPAGTGMQVYSDVEAVNTHASSDDPYVNALRTLLSDEENEPEVETIDE